MGQHRAKHISLEEYECPDCGYIWPIYRSKSRMRERGHLKRIYCVQCREEKNFKKREYVTATSLEKQTKYEFAKLQDKLVSMAEEHKL